MGIASLQFIAFVTLATIVFYISPCKYQWIVLLGASTAFYLSFSIGGMFVLLGTALMTWFLALQIQKSKDAEKAWLVENRKTVDKETRKAKKEEFHRQQRRYELLDIVITIGILFLTKYYGSMAKGINLSAGTTIWTAENILLPLGISYYSLQLMGYIIDVTRDIVPAEKNPFKVVLYGMFFLSIMQGPFNRYNELMPQVCKEDRPRFSTYQLKRSSLRIAGGYIKKLCIADQVGIIANEVFTNYAQYSGVGIIFGIVCFAIQLYADFSGYMDIIIGVGELFGVRMPENFRQPFFSRTMSEFWKRWHITLGMWLQDYVFYPILKSNTLKNLGKKITDRYGKEAGRRIPTNFGMLILWVLIGAWHGAGFNYIFGVGILQFLYIFIGEIAKPVTDKAKLMLKIKEDGLPWHVFQSLRCTLLMMIAWVFFKSRTFYDALNVFKRIPTNLAIGFNSFISIFSSQAKGITGVRWQIELIYVFVCVVVLLLLDIYHEVSTVSLRDRILSQKYPIRLLCYLVLVFTILVFGAYGNSYNAAQFIYFDF